VIRRLPVPAVLPLLAGLTVAVSCALPLGWLIWQIAANPTTLRLLHPDAIRWDILGRTCLYSALAAVLATLLATPAAMSTGLRRGRFSGLVAFALPLTLLLPSLVYAYGWAQCFRLLAEPAGRWLASAGANRDWLAGFGISLVGQGESARLFLVNAGPADVGRCVLSLAAWLWPIPAGAMIWALRRADPALRQQAQLDGAAGRIAARQVLPAAMVGALAVWVLASQEFAVYEPTGVSVVATEVRMVFETGSFSSGSNPITAPMGGAMFGGGDAPPSSAGGSAATLPMPQGPQDVQQRAAAAAVATGVPMLLLTAVMGAIVAVACRRWSAESDEVHEHPAEGTPASSGTTATGAIGRERRLAATPSLTLPRRTGGGDWRRTGGGNREGVRRASGGRLWLVAAVAVIVFTVGVPLASMIICHQRGLDLVFIWREFNQFILGSLFSAGLAGLAAVVIILGGLQQRPGVWRWVALASFMVGGQLLAIALIRLYNRQHLGWVYNAPPIMVMAYLGRFGWLALLAAAATWSRPWRLLRQQAALDGAGPATIVGRVIWPLAWPVVAGAGVLVLVLCLTEVPATVLVTPMRPLPQIVPMLMTWVHTLESDPMIEASLLLAAASMVLGTAGTVLIRAGSRMVRSRSEGDVV